MRLYRKFIYPVIIAVLPLFTYGQTKDQPLPNWQNLDLKMNKVFGISTERAYEDLLKGKTSTPVIVAVIDGGVDSNHEDLKDVIWRNAREIAGNGKDDDLNGYVDDINGWNFIGSIKGNVKFDNLELVRLIKKYQDRYASVLNSSPLSPQERKEFNLYKKMNIEYMGKLQNAHMGNESFAIINKTLDTIERRINRNDITSKEILDYKPKNKVETNVLKLVKAELKKEPEYKKVKDDLREVFNYYKNQLSYHLNIQFDPRDSIGDNYANSLERWYGNNDVTGPDALHGSHVGGIIGAVRSNNVGIKGVANNIQIMPIRTVPDGDERDKDVANAIRYAVDNGARVINMSFGKAYSWDKAVVDSAVKYAELKDVLLVHAAGNDSKNNDIENNFPTKFYGDTTDANFWGLNSGMQLELLLPPNSNENGRMDGMGKQRMPLPPKIDSTKLKRPHALNWIEVGASSWIDDENLVASFSNYGSKTVDVFAPGVKINSTVSFSKYKEEDGTSMASPVVAGLAALLRSYYPKLTAIQTKDIILKSVTKVDHKVKIKENGSSKKLYLKDLCISGGIVNAYNAVLLAQKTLVISTAVNPNVN